MATKKQATADVILPPRAPAIDILDALRVELEQVNRDHKRHLEAIEESSHRLICQLHEIQRSVHAGPGSHVYLSAPRAEMLTEIRERCAAADAMQSERQRLKWLIGRVQEARGMAVDR